jgi:hypothetical protein
LRGGGIAVPIELVMWEEGFEERDWGGMMIGEDGIGIGDKMAWGWKSTCISMALGIS